MLRTTVKRLKKILVNEMVVVHVDMYPVSLQTGANEAVLIPPRIEGVIVDIDLDFVYIGDADGVHTTVPMGKICFIEVVKDIDVRINIHEPLPEKGELN
jgi:hypothetical protein